MFRKLSSCSAVLSGVRPTLKFMWAFFSFILKNERIIHTLRQKPTQYERNTENTNAKKTRLIRWSKKICSIKKDKSNIPRRRVRPGSNTSISLCVSSNNSLRR